MTDKIWFGLTILCVLGLVNWLVDEMIEYKVKKAVNTFMYNYEVK